MVRYRRTFSKIAVPPIGFPDFAVAMWTVHRVICKIVSAIARNREWFANGLSDEPPRGPRASRRLDCGHSIVSHCPLAALSRPIVRQAVRLIATAGKRAAIALELPDLARIHESLNVGKQLLAPPREQRNSPCRWVWRSSGQAVRAHRVHCAARSGRCLGSG